LLNFLSVKTEAICEMATAAVMSRITGPPGPFGFTPPEMLSSSKKADIASALSAS
jgi:hypothetical protein